MSTTNTVPQLTSVINGEERPGSRTIADTNPSDPSEIVATVSLGDIGTATAAIASASEAFGEWSSSRPQQRAEVLGLAADLLDQRAEAIGRDITREEGKTLAESVREVQLSARILRFYAGQVLAAQGETYPSQSPNVLLYSKREPVGVVTAITPWNFPMSIPAWKVAPALAHGNTVVWKPADLVPLTARHLWAALHDAGLPAGVLNLVLGKGSEVGQILVTHPAVNAVTFTGSNEVGRLVQAQASASGKKVQLELGGKNAAIVLSDADLDRAAEQTAMAAFSGTGQKCTATSRLIVERGVVDDVVERLVGETHQRWTVGDPLDSATTVGPLASEDALTSVLGHVDIATSDGARLVSGGRRAEGALAKGYFVPPTVLVDVGRDDSIAQEEVFGPVLAVLTVDSYEEAVDVANGTRYGLSASVYTRDLGKALRFAEESRSGIVKVNQATSGNEFHVPFGGTKDSGSGYRELGTASREFFTESKSVYIAF